PLRARLCMSEATPESHVIEEFDTEFLLNASEIYIFSASRQVVEQLWTAEQSVKSGELDASAFVERGMRLFGQLSTLAEATGRFGIITPFSPEFGFSPFFWRWFNWWYDYHDGLSPQQLEHIHRLQETHDPAALQYRPYGDWLAYPDNPPFGFDMSRH